MKIAATLLMLFVLFPLHTSGQNYTQWSLPEGAKARLGKGQIIRKGMITGNIAYSPDDNRLAMASSIGIWIYDGHTGEELALLTGHTRDVLAVSFKPNSSTLASGSREGTVLLWEYNSSAFPPPRSSGNANSR